MKILYHHRTRGDGAEGVHIQEMITAFKKLNHDVRLCCPPSAKRPAGLRLGMTGTSVADSRGLSGSLVVFARQFMELCYNLISGVRLTIAIIRFRPDMVYERYSCYHFAGVWVSRLFHTSLVLEVNSTYVGRYNRRKLAMRFVAGQIEKYVLTRSTLVTTVSNPIRDCVLDREVEPERVIVTPNAINEDNVHQQSCDGGKTRQEWAIPPDAITIGFVGSLRRWHGVDLLTKIIPQVLEEVPKSVFLIVGSGELESELQKLKRNGDIDARLILTGGVEHSQVNSLISAMDIGLMPHSNSWGSPMKILEYMSMGKLSISPRLAPIEEIVQDNVTGILFELGNRVEFISAITQACHDQERRRSIGKTAREYVLAERRWTDNAQTVLDNIKRYVVSNNETSN